MEANSEESIAQFALALGSRGNLRTTTMHAFTEAQFGKIASGISRASTGDVATAAPPSRAGAFLG
jgi:hypothetical protein